MKFTTKIKRVVGVTALKLTSGRFWITESGVVLLLNKKSGKSLLWLSWQMPFTYSNCRFPDRKTYLEALSTP